MLAVASASVRERLRSHLAADGEHLDTGGWVRMLEYAAEVEARVLGKPSADFLGADLAAARAVGARAALVRTGKAGGDHPRAADAGAVIDGVADLAALLG